MRTTVLVVVACLVSGSLSRSVNKQEDSFFPGDDRESSTHDDEGCGRKHFPGSRSCRVQRGGEVITQSECWNIPGESLTCSIGPVNFTMYTPEGAEVRQAYFCNYPLFDERQGKPCSLMKSGVPRDHVMPCERGSHCIRGPYTSGQYTAFFCYHQEGPWEDMLEELPEEEEDEGEEERLEEELLESSEGDKPSEGGEPFEGKSEEFVVPIDEDWDPEQPGDEHEPEDDGEPIDELSEEEEKPWEQDEDWIPQHPGEEEEPEDDGEELHEEEGEEPAEGGEPFEGESEEFLVPTDEDGKPLEEEEDWNSQQPGEDEEAEDDGEPPIDEMSKKKKVPTATLR